MRSRLAWAGFPGAIERRLGHPQLCCFSGIICSMIHGEGRRKRYILDGHVTKGVSGGPVWHWSEERDRLEVVGIISCVPAVTDGRPGYLFVEPINPVMLYLEDWRAKSPDDFVITACRN